jgi:predicted dinucleotide-binding enzyme
VRSSSAPDTAPIPDAVAGADVVLLAVPGAATKNVLQTLGAALDGKVVIDATNDVGGSGALHALDELGDGAHPVRAFNTLGWENLADPVFDGIAPTSSTQPRKATRKRSPQRLIADVGLRPVWLGGVEAFDLVDSLTQLWFTLAFQRELGRRLAFKMLGGE